MMKNQYAYCYRCPYYFNCLFYKKHRQINSKHTFSSSSKIQVKTERIEYEKEYIEVDLRYPVFYGIKNKNAQEFINNSIKSDVMEFRRQMEESAKEYAEKARREGEKIEPYVVSTVYEITYNKNNILSVSMIYHEYINRKHWYLKASYNFNIQTGTPLGLREIFKKGVDYQQLINREIRKRLKENEEKYLPETIEKFKGIAVDQPFYLENGSLVVYFGFNQIAPRGSEIPVIKIPLSAFRNKIRDMFI
jgi:hypothetical protein